MAEHCLVLASGNRGKLREMTAILQPLGWQVRPQSDWNVPDAIEDGLSCVENALIKARHASRLPGQAPLGGESGLAVDFLAGAPGICSARYAGEGAGDNANNAKLLEALANVPEQERGAHFYCAMVLVRHAEDPAPLIAIGRWDGRILESPQGEGGFGYDPLFWVPGHACTSAQLPPEVKNSLSHRGRALRLLVKQIDEEPGG